MMLSQIEDHPLWKLKPVVDNLLSSMDTKLKKMVDKINIAVILIIMEVKTSGKAIVSLVCGILSIFTPIFGIALGILGIIFGCIAKNEIRKSQGKFTGEGMAIAGLVCGIIGVASSVFWVWLFGIMGKVIFNEFNSFIV